MKKLLIALLIPLSTWAGQITQTTAEMQVILDGALQTSDGGTLSNTTAEVQTTIEGAFASIYVDDGTNSQTIATGANYVKCTLFQNAGQEVNATADIANDKITITKNGTYQGSASCSFTGATAGIDWYGALFVNGIEQHNIHWVRKIGTPGDYGSAAALGFFSVTNAPVDVDLRLRSSRTPSDGVITILFSNLSVHLVGQ